MKISTYLSLIPLLAILLIVPSDVSAQGFVPCDGADCNFCHFVVMGNEILKWLFGLVFVIFGALMFIAGFGLVTSGGNQSKLDDAKKKLSNAVVGIIIVFVAWLIVDTLIKTTVNEGSLSGVKAGPWNEIECSGGQTVPIEAVGDDGVREGSETWWGGGGVVDEPGELTHEEAVDRLNDGVFTLSSTGGCTDSSRSNCTSLEGVKELTIDRMNELQEAIGAPLVITGGTEDGHADGTYSHANGNKIDLRPTPELNDYIYENFEQIGDTTYRDANGNTYYRHPPDHWDVTIRG